MQTSKLFRVLVLGGVVLVGAGCGSTPEHAPDVIVMDPVVVTEQDVESEPVVIDAGSTPDTGIVADLSPCLCGTECCVDDGHGGRQAQSGFECCWGTSC